MSDDDYDDYSDDEIPEEIIDGEEQSCISMEGLNDPEKASAAIKLFFYGQDKVPPLHWAIGGMIPEDKLFQERYLNLIRNIQFTYAIDLAYAIIEKHANYIGSFSRSGPYVKDLEIDMCLYVLHRAARLYIPAGYIGGIFLIYLELVEGVELI